MNLRTIIKEAATGPVVQPTAAIDALVNQSYQARSGLIKFSSALANEIESIFDLAHPKSLQRIFEKATKKYDGNYARVLDLTRGCIPVDSVEQIVAADRILDPSPSKAGERPSEFLSSWAKKGYFVREYENMFASPSKAGLRGITVKLEVPFSNGSFHICELQIQHVAMLDAMTESHSYFETQRKLIDEIDPESTSIDSKTAAKYVNLTEARKKIHDDAALVAGLSTLVDPSSKYRPEPAPVPAQAHVLKFDKVG